MKFKFLAFLSILASVLVSCQDVVQFQVEELDPKIVVEGQVSNNPQDNYIKLTYNQDFYDSLAVKPATGRMHHKVDGSQPSDHVTAAVKVAAMRVHVATMPQAVTVVLPPTVHLPHAAKTVAIPAHQRGTMVLKRAVTETTEVP